MEEDDMTLPGERVVASFADLKSPALRDMLSPTPCIPAVPRAQPKITRTQRTSFTTLVTDSDWQIYYVSLFSELKLCARKSGA